MWAHVCVASCVARVFVWVHVWARAWVLGRVWVWVRVCLFCHVRVVVCVGSRVSAFVG